MTNSPDRCSAESCVLRWARPMGATFDSMRKHVWETGLADIGDTILIWVNEGDFWEAMIKGVQLKEYKNPDGGGSAVGVPAEMQGSNDRGLAQDAEKPEDTTQGDRPARPVTCSSSGVTFTDAQPEQQTAVTEAMIDAAVAAIDEFPFSNGLADDRAPMRAALEAALAAQPPAAPVETDDYTWYDAYNKLSAAYMGLIAERDAGAQCSAATEGEILYAPLAKEGEFTASALYPTDEIRQLRAAVEYWRLAAERRDERRERTGLDIPEARTLDAPGDEPQAIQVSSDQVARTIALSYGRDPDALTEWTEMCDAHNRPVPIWKVYEEQAEALLAAYSMTRPHGGGK